MTYLMEHGMRLVDGSNSTSTNWKALKEGAYWLHVEARITQLEKEKIIPWVILSEVILWI